MRCSVNHSISIPLVGRIFHQGITLWWDQSALPNSWSRWNMLIKYCKNETPRWCIHWPPTGQTESTFLKEQVWLLGHLESSSLTQNISKYEDSLWPLWLWQLEQVLVTLRSRWRLQHRGELFIPQCDTADLGVKTQDCPFFFGLMKL